MGENSDDRSDSARQWIGGSHPKRKEFQQIGSHRFQSFCCFTQAVNDSPNNQ
jgi:hypothetical protein